MNVENASSGIYNLYSLADVFIEPSANFNINENSNFIIIGAGKTIKSMLKFLSKHGYNKFSIYNRDKKNAVDLIDCLSINAEAKELNQLSKHNESFDVIISCTGSSDIIINKEKIIVKNIKKN